jgi:hypothetical protein
MPEQARATGGALSVKALDEALRKAPWHADAGRMPSPAELDDWLQQQPRNVRVAFLKRVQDAADAGHDCWMRNHEREIERLNIVIRGQQSTIEAQEKAVDAWRDMGRTHHLIPTRKTLEARR